MKLSKQRKGLVVVLALALAGLAVDRVFLGAADTGPKRASAKTVAAGGPRAAAASSAALATTTVVVVDLLADRLRRLSQKQDVDMKAVRDAFSCPADWVPNELPTAPAKPAHAEALEFQARHQLMAVMAGARGSAIVDGKCLLIGQKLGKYKLMSVGKRSAVFQCGDQRVTLRLKE